MRKESIVRSKSLKILKLLVGPNMPRAGPILEIQLIVAENVVSKSILGVVRIRVPRAMLKIYSAKKISTLLIAVSSRGLPLIFMRSMARG